MAWLAEIAKRSSRLLAHWRLGARPDGWADGIRMSRETHVRFCESRG